MKTKQLLAGMLATFCFCSAQAQTHYVAKAQEFRRDFTGLNQAPSYSGIFYNSINTLFINEKKYNRFKKLRTGGIVLTSIGAGFMITGSALIISDNNENEGYNDDIYDEGLTSDDAKSLAGAVAIVFGAVTTAGGITMWIIGNNKMKKYGAGQISVQPSKNGLGLAYRF